MNTKNRILNRRTRRKAKLLPYEADFFKWTQTQANLLKKEEFTKLDIDNLIEEIESLGKSQRDKLESHLTILLMHLLKIEYQPTHHSKSWDLSVKNARHHVKKTIEQNPSLKSKMAEILNDAYYSARLMAAQETGLDEKVFPKSCKLKIEEILTGKN